MQTFARLGKAAGRAAVPVAAGVVSTASQPVAQAECLQSDVLSRRRIQDEWELLDTLETKVLFKPDEIDDAISLLREKPQSAVIEEVDSDISSDGCVDAIIERGMPYAVGQGGSLPLDMNELCTLASKLLKSPGVQREICSAALSDPEVFSILASKMDLPEYLEATGFAAKGLLMGSEAAVAGQEGCDSSSSEGSDPSATITAAAGAMNPLQVLSSRVGEGVEQLGLAVARLGRWMRSQLPGQQDAEAAAAAAEAGTEARPKRVDSVLGAVMVVCVAVIALVVLRRPSALRGMLRRRVA